MWYMHNPKSFLENETLKVLWDFEIQIDHIILARRLDLVIVNNNNNNKERADRIVDFAVPADHRVKLKESENRDKYLEPNKTMEHEGDGDTNYNWGT